MDDILTRQEVSALIAANEKVATQLTVIAGQLSLITSGQEKLLVRLQNGIKDDVIDALMPEVKAPALRLERIEGRLGFISWVVSAAGSIVALVGLKALYGILSGKP